METEFQNAFGKGAGEVRRDIADFLGTPYVINREKKIDLCSLVEDLNMHEQFTFAFLNEAEAQGWESEHAESFYRHAVSGIIEPTRLEAVIAAFHNKEGEAYLSYDARYGNRFSLLDGSYWATVLALGIDAEEVSEVMQYLRLFTVTLMELAYMEDRNPEETYTWCYYESFRQMLDELAAPPEPAPAALLVRALGGSVSQREGESYYLSLGLDIENPDTGHMARGVQLDITLKDGEGNIITVIGDKLESLDPGAVYHYGITRKIRGAAIGSISAVARASSHLKLTTPLMKHFALSDLHISRSSEGMQFSCTLNGEYDCPLRTLTLHYQFLSKTNKILGGGSEWLADGMQPGTPVAVLSKAPVPIANVAKVVYSMDFDALELVKE